MVSIAGKVKLILLPLK